MYKVINGMQHIGVGTANHEKSWKWYRKFFGLDIPFFNAVAPAPLMDRYTNNSTITKRAAMVLNLQGGCAMEIVQPTSFTAKPADFEVQLGDYGIFITQIKSHDVAASYKYFKENGADVLGELTKTPMGIDTFYVKDPNGLIFQIIEGGEWFSKISYPTGGINGCSIGVSDVDGARVLYSDLLGFDKLVYEDTKVFEDFSVLPGGNSKVRRVILTQSEMPGGGFGKVSGKTFIELIQVLDRKPKKIFENRIWGDVGFVHLGMDVRGMKAIGKDLAEKGYGFTCDSKDVLSMGNTKVHCTYIEDMDGTLIEMIETYKIPLVEKWGIYLNVEKRNPRKPLPKFMLKTLRFGRIKDK